jgi:hypothetical protein
MHLPIWLVLALALLLSFFLPARADDTPDLAKIKIAADAGDPAAQYKLALACSDSKQAELWYRKSAEQGYATAQGQLGCRLFFRYGTAMGVSPAEKAAIGEEAFKWLTLGANQGDTLAQGYLASVYLEGKIVTQDLLQAYKWGVLASRGSSVNVGSTTGQSASKAAILKLNADQIAQAQKEVEQFKPHQAAPPLHPPTPLPSGLKLKGLCGTAANRLAIINNKTFAKGDTLTIKLADKAISVCCVEIRVDSVLITIDGSETPQELKLASQL